MMLCEQACDSFGLMTLSVFILLILNICHSIQIAQPEFSHTPELRKNQIDVQQKMEAK